MPSGLFSGHGITLVASAARTTSSNSGNLKDTTSNLPISDAITLVADMTAYTGATGPPTVPTLEVYLQTSPDGGTTWFTADRFATMTGSSSQQRMNLRTSGIGPSEVATLGSMAQATTTTGSQNTVYTRDIRVVWEFNPSATCTFGVYALATPVGRYNG